MSDELAVKVLDALLQQAIELQRAGRVEEALPLYESIIEQRPGDSAAMNNIAIAYRKLGRSADALRVYRTLLERDPRSVVVNQNLANLLLDLGQTADALEHLRRATAIEPDKPQPWRRLGEVLLRAGLHAQAAEAYLKAVALSKDDARLIADCAAALHYCGRTEEAVAYLRRAVELEPTLESARSNLATLLPRLIPQWHFPMLGDVERNRAFRRAIERAVRPETSVLDIGTGSGLLAMMAARAGARHVWACESNRSVSDVARSVIERNGYADRISVIAKPSAALQIGRDLPEPVDLVVAEIVDVGLFGEGVMPTFADAVRRLLKPGGTIIPRAGTLWGMLVECPTLRAINPVGEVEGFDLTPMNLFLSNHAKRVDIADGDVRALSAPVQLAAVDFANPRHPPERVLEFSIRRDGVAQAMVCWFELTLDEATRISSRSPARTNHWKQAIKFLPEDRPVATGAAVSVVVRTGDAGPDFAWPAAAASAPSGDDAAPAAEAADEAPAPAT